ncbi:MAG TPA: chemotaxis protein CheW [Gammaproteobacteria bacterium]|nr:chemotaxis protein CheW [Gammaproteobacteria bacterium]
MNERTGVLLKQGDALREYLDALLREVGSDDVPEEAVSVEPASREPRAVQRTESAPLEALKAEPAPAPVAERERESAQETRRGRLDGGVPDWARPDFQALLFHVGRLKLAVPLIKLHGVLPWSDQISAMPNQPRWCHGVFRYRERNVTVIDTETLVVPSDRRADIAAGEAGEVDEGRILIVGDGSWGLACREVGEVIKLTPDEVKWRGHSATRPWLAGTVLGRLCALMDTEAFADMLREGRAGGAARGKGVNTPAH